MGERDARSADRRTITIGCLICDDTAKATLDYRLVVPPADWYSGGHYFVCEPCAGLVRASGISIDYVGLCDCDIRLSVSWSRLRHGKGVGLPLESLRF